MATLYQKLGGEAAINAVVDKFYEFMLADPKVNHYYNKSDMSKLRCRQKQFITLVTGGPHNYEGTDMFTAHCKYNITKSDFDITWRHLEESLLFFKVERSLIQELKTIFYSVEGEVVKSHPVVVPGQQPLEKNLSNEKSSGCPMKAGSGCPFKLKVTAVEVMEEAENKPLKLSNEAYLKWNY